MQLDLITHDVSAARIARDVGMQQAQDHPDRVIDDWSERAYGFLVDYAAANPGMAFMGEDIRAAADGAGFPAPPDSRALGPVVSRAFRARIIKRIGYGPARSSNLSPKCIWRAR